MGSREDYVINRDRQRQKDVKLARLIGLPVMCLYGTWDPEAGYFSPDMPNPLRDEVDKRNNESINLTENLSDNIPYVILDVERHKKLIDAMIVSRYGVGADGKLEYIRCRRHALLDDDISDDVLPLDGTIPKPSIGNETFFVDLLELPWNPETAYTGLHRGTEFCTGELSQKKWWWKEVQHYCADLNAIAEIEQLLIKHNLIEDYIIQLIHITKEQSSLAAIKASAEQKVDASLAVLENNQIK